MAAKKKSTAKGKKASNAISLLEADHAKVRKLLSELEETTSRGVKKREELLEEIASEVRVHARVEEEVFYPAFRRAGKANEDEKMFFEAAEEHGLVDIVLPALEGTDPASELFSARAKILKDLIEHHAEEEETEMFPRARELMSGDLLGDLAVEIEQRKGELGDGRNVGRKGARGSDRRAAAVLATTRDRSASAVR